MELRAGLALALTLAVGCGGGDGGDAGPIPFDGGRIDSGAVDASTDDAGAPDGGVIDAGTDSGTTDGGADGGAADAGAADAGADGGGPLDGGPSDAGSMDAATTDGGADAGASTDGGPASAPEAGELVIVEVQGNPVRASDPEAEYFEVLNVSGRNLDLNGIWLAYRAFTGGEPDASEPASQVVGSFVLGPGQRALFGRSSGGFFGDETPDVTYDHFEFSNGGSTATRLRILVPSWGGAEPPAAADLVDGVVFSPGTFDDDLRGRAYQFDPGVGAATSSNNDDLDNWCHTSSAASGLEYREDNFGTPRRANDCG